MDFELKGSLCIVLSLLIHKISSKPYRDTTAFITRITFGKVPVSVFSNTFRYAANEFYLKLCLTVYSRLLI